MALFNPSQKRMTIRQALSKLDDAKEQTKTIKKAYMDALVTAVKYYGDTLIASHFTRGNQGRMGWAALSPRYAARKEMEHPGEPMLVATGRLKQSIVGNYKLDKDDNTLKCTLDFNQAVDYAEYHEDGTPNMPQRKWSQPTQGDREKIEKKLEERFVANLRKNKLITSWKKSGLEII